MRQLHVDHLVRAGREDEGEQEGSNDIGRVLDRHIHDDVQRRDSCDEQRCHDHAHGGHENDQGINGALRYLRRLPQMWRSTINDAIVALVGPQPRERVLDIGAGMGAGAMGAARSGARVIAVEPTPFMRRILAARRMTSRRRSRIEVVEGTARLNLGSLRRARRSTARSGPRPAPPRRTRRRRVGSASGVARSGLDPRG